MLMVMVANSQLPSVTAQDVGRELYHGRQDVVQIIGDEPSLKKVAWIFERVPDMFEVQCQYATLIVRRATAHTADHDAIMVDVGASVLVS
jgi:hypothetical protein